jgi:hypothetical protein
MNNKPDKIEQIQFSEEDKQFIDAIINGKPNPDIIQRWKDAGYNVEHRIKWYIPVRPKERMLKIRQKYRIGKCHNCQQFPSVKLTWKLEGANLVEYWCDTCYGKRYNK